mmetsp:Transcript_4111/g.10585  ORF Transcript_4111/g.10585 Transcript_4111/m.10585 type:complete len:135 (-) Transcript_4111:19-423(-)
MRHVGGGGGGGRSRSSSSSEKIYLTKVGGAQSSADGARASALGPSNGPPKGKAAGEEPPTLRSWFEGQVRELDIMFELEVLWMAFNEISEDDLGNHEVLKMWLGLCDEDKLPTPILDLVSAFRQQRALMRFQAG